MGGTAVLNPASASDNPNAPALNMAAASDATAPILAQMNPQAGTENMPFNPQLQQAQQQMAAGPPQVQPSPQPTVTQTVDPALAAAAVHHSRLASILDAVGSILGGTQTIHLTKDADGNVSVTHDPSSTGEKWSRVAQAALQGAAQGFAVGQGPGGAGRAAGVGFETGMQQQQQQEQQAQQEAQTATAANQKDKLFAANMIRLNQDITAATFNNQQARVQATQAQITQANANNELLSNAPGSTDMGIVPVSTDLHKLALSNPNFYQQHTDGTTVGFPVFDEKGNITGLHAYVVDKAWMNRINDTPITYLRAVANTTPGGAPTFKQETIPARSGMTNGQIMQFMQQNETANLNTNATLATANRQQEQLTQEAPVRAAQAFEARAAGQKNLAEAGQINAEAGGGGAGGTIQQNAAMMVDGLMAPSQMSKRAKDYNALLPAAQAYSMQKYGQPFDAEVSEARYRARTSVIKDYSDGKQADQIQSFNQFLGHAENLSNSVNAFRTTGSPLLNVPYNKLRTMTGNPAVNAMLPQIEAVRTEYQNFLNNNHALHEADIREGAKMLDENASPAQMQAAMKSFAHVALTRTASLNDRYRRTMGTNVPEILSDGSINALQHFGLGDIATTQLRLNEPTRNTMVNLAGGQPTQPATATQPTQLTTPQTGGTPPLSKLSEGQVSTFGNGQQWTLRNGQPVQLK